MADHFAKLRAELGPPGVLHRALKIPPGKKLPPYLLARLAKSSGTLGREAKIAELFSHFHPHPPTRK